MDKFTYPNNSISQIFNMENMDFSIKTTIIYHKYTLDGKDYGLGCSLRFALFFQGMENRPFFSADANVHSDETSLELLQISGAKRSGTNLLFKGIDIKGIAFEETDRLLTFIKQMYGVRVTYQEDIFGFLAKNGKDEKITLSLPFPELAEHVE